MYLTSKQANDKSIVKFLAEQALDEQVHTISKLDGGVSSNTYEINNHLIFKLPSVRTPLEKWDEQSQCAPVLQKHFSVQIPHPKINNVFLSSSSQIPILALSYEKVLGQPILDDKEFFKKDKSFKRCYFEQLGQFAHQLHLVNPKELPVSIPTAQDFLQNMFSRKIGGISEKQRKIFLKIIYSPRFALNLNTEKTVLCHCDLRPANVCLDKKGKIVGILDFDSLNMGKTYMEFRPKLYGPYNKEADTKQFFQTYYQQIGLPVPEREFKNTRRMLHALYVFCMLSKIHNTTKAKFANLSKFFKCSKIL